MKRKYRTLLSVILGILGLLGGIFVFQKSLPASAAQPLFFSENTSPSLRIDIMEILKKMPDEGKPFSAGYLIAETDLNDDFSSDYIIQAQPCSAQSKSCLYLIIVQKNDHILEILNVLDAKNIVIARAKTNGVRDILAFQDTINDYKYRRYIWSPEKSFYIPENSR